MLCLGVIGLARAVFVKRLAPLLSLSLALSLPLTRARSGVQEMQLAAGQLRDEIDVMKKEKGKRNGKWRLEMMKGE